MTRLGILGCSDIAYKRFMPAAINVEGLNVVAVAEEYAPEKLESFCSQFNLEMECCFEHLILREDIDAVYIPQPPALHYKWSKYALENGKHVLVEKPSTTAYALTQDMVKAAEAKKLTLHENYMFQYHSQISTIRSMLDDGVVGDIRLIKANFGFPMRAQNDFRYNKELGGGALLDAGGYTVKLASILLGETVRVDTAHLNGIDGYDIDMYGSASLSNDEGTVCQVGFGMDCAYQCSLEVWGSKGRLFTNRIFTAPDGYSPVVVVETAAGSNEYTLSPDSHFRKSIEQFLVEIADDTEREAMYANILRQSKLIHDIQMLSAK